MRGTRIGGPDRAHGGVMDVYVRNRPKMNVHIPSTFATTLCIAHYSRLTITYSQLNIFIYISYEQIFSGLRGRPQSYLGRDFNITDCLL